MKLSICVVLVAVLFGIQVCYASHPAEGLEPTLPPNIDELSLLPAEWSMGDITFIPLDEWPDYRNLIPLKQYILFGAASPDGSGEVVLNACSESVFATVVKFYTEYDYIPAVLNANNLRMIPNYEKAHGDFLDVYRNPLTGA